MLAIGKRLADNNNSTVAIILSVEKWDDESSSLANPPSYAEAKKMK